MEPIFIYYNNLKFKDNEFFTVEFCNEDQLQGIMFRKARDYYITSMSCYIQLTNDISKLTHYKEIKKNADLLNSILKSGIDYTYIGKDLEVFFDLSKLEFEVDKSNHALSVDVAEFFDYVTKQKRFVLIYSPYKELKKFGMKCKEAKTKNSDISSYSVKLLEEKGKTYPEKEIFFNKQKLLQQIEKEYDNKNVIFFEPNSIYWAFKFKITAAYFKKLLAKNGRDFQKFIYDVLFPIKSKRYNYLIESKEDYMIVSHPIAIELKTMTIAKNINIYISPEMYTKNKSFMKSLVEVNEVIVTSTMLQNFRNRLSDQSYTVSKIHGFRGSSFKKMVISKDDFVLPDFKIDIHLKDRKYSSQTLRDLFEHSYSLLNTDGKVKTLAPSNIESALIGKLEYIKSLSKRINLKSLSHICKNFFLYHLENMIKTTFVTELGKNFSIYCLISFSGKTK